VTAPAENGASPSLNCVAGDVYGRSIAIEEVCMPQANTPEDLGRLVGEAVTSGDIDAVLSLYEPDATFAIPRAFGEGSVTGLDGLREAFDGVLAMSPKLVVNAEKTLLSGDTALVTGSWTLKGRDADGNDIDAGGRYADVVRRQPDGSWLFVIDNPNGSD
jgi:ketosteroid isomerase-like protein